MSNIITFIPRRALSAKQNLKDFIETARNVIPTWSELKGFKWENARWPTPYSAIRFTNEENARLHPSVSPKLGQLMHPEFMEAAKAYIRYRHHTEPHRNLGREMAAFRALEYVLRMDMGVPDITLVTQAHFESSVSIIARHKGAAFIARELLSILTRLAEHSIVTRRAHLWTHRYLGSLSYEQTNGALAPQEVKDKKLPDQDALLAIGHVFSRGYEEQLADADVLVTSITATLLSAPMRIAEIIRFRTECIGNDKDKNGAIQYYLKYWVPKTKDFARKPIPAAMAETAIEAIRRLKEITDEGRRLARYMEENPTTFYRHEDCPNVPDDKILTGAEVAQALGYKDARSCTDYIRSRTGKYSIAGFTLNSLWQIVLQDHRESNPHFPYQQPTNGENVRPLKMSDSLLCCRRDQFSVGRKTSPVLLAPFNQSYYSKRLEARENKNGRHKPGMCFYSRHGFEPIRLKSHGPRHLLNRLAKQSGLTVDVITAWSSRSSHRQTLTYLDNDRGEAAATAVALLGINNEHETKAPITSEEAEIYGQGPIHRSRYGLCLRSWRVGPCNKFADCLNCSELLICKGDRVAADLIAADRNNMEATFNAAQEAIVRGERSATRWTKLTKMQIIRLNELISILNDPLIPDGSPVQIAGADFSHEQTLVDKTAEAAGILLLGRDKLGIEYGNDLLACLDELVGGNKVA